MGQLTETTVELQAVIDNVDAGNAGKTVISDASDTSATAVKKAGFHPIGASSSNAPNTETAVIITAARDSASSDLRYAQVLVTDSNDLFVASDSNGTKSSWAQMATVATAQTLTNKTLTSPVLTTPQINDTSSDHQYIFVASELAADRNVTLPLLGADDEFTFNAATQTLTNKTLTSPAVTGMTGGAASGFTAGNLTLADGSITDSSGAISFGNENLLTTGTLGAGATTVTTLDASGAIFTSGVSAAIYSGSEVLSSGMAAFKTTSASSAPISVGNGTADGPLIKLMDTGGTSRCVISIDNATAKTDFDSSFGFLFGSGPSTFAGDVLPSVTESLDLGSASLEWDNIYLQNAATVSDERRKNDLGALDGKWIKFFDSLTAKLYTFKDRVIKEAVPAKKVEQQKTETLKEEHTTIEIVDGVPVQTTKKVEVKKPVFKDVPVVDEKGNPVTVEHKVLDENGEDTGEVELRPVTHPVPVMEWVEIPAEDEVISSHSRPHSGFMAQAVKASMDVSGIDDWSGYAYDKEADKHMLRYQEFIAPLLFYIQEKTKTVL